MDVPALVDAFAASGLDDDTFAVVADELRLVGARLDAADRLCAAVVRNESMQPASVVTAAAEYLSLSAAQMATGPTTDQSAAA